MTGRQPVKSLLCIFLTSSSISLSLPAFATQHAMYKDLPVSTLWHPLITFSGGAAFTSNVGQSKYIPPVIFAEDSFYNYQANNRRETEPVFGILLASEMRFRPDWSLQVGVNYNQPYSFNGQGVLTQGPVSPTTGLPSPGASNQYNYRYMVTSHQVLALVKVLYNWRERFHPNASLGLGMSYNRAFNFSAGLTPPNTTLSNNFQNYSEYSFSYSAGLGLDVDINPNWRVGVGYRFTDYGPARTDNSIIDTGGTNNDGLFNPPIGSNNNLSAKHLYSNEVTAQITYLLD